MRYSNPQLQGVHPALLVEAQIFFPYTLLSHALSSPFAHANVLLLHTASLVLVVYPRLSSASLVLPRPPTSALQRIPAHSWVTPNPITHACPPRRWPRQSTIHPHTLKLPSNASTSMCLFLKLINIRTCHTSSAPSSLPQRQLHPPNRRIPSQHLPKGVYHTTSRLHYCHQPSLSTFSCLLSHALS